MQHEDFPLFDGHMHFSHAYLDDVLASYEECGVRGGLNIWAPEFHDYHRFLETCRERGLLERFAQFYWPNWARFGWQGEEFVRELCDDMDAYAAEGVTGLKIWKDIGMYNFNADGTPVVMDDERLNPVWEKVEKLGWSVACHQADPSGGFMKRSRTRIPKEELFERRNRVIADHPDVVFSLCHSGNDIEDYARFGELLDRFGNTVADLRWPANFEHDPDEERAFLEKYAHRLMIGPDLGMPQNRPPDRPWNLNEGYRPKRASLLAYGLSDEAFENITWKTGETYFLRGRS